MNADGAVRARDAVVARRTAGRRGPVVRRGQRAALLDERARARRRTVRQPAFAAPAIGVAPALLGSTGMYSMKRTCSGRSSVIFAKPSRSCSSERTTTTLSLTGSKPASNAASRPASASSSLPPRVMRA